MVRLLKLGSAEALAAQEEEGKGFPLHRSVTAYTQRSCSRTRRLLQFATVTPRLVCCHPVSACKLKLPCLP